MTNINIKIDDERKKKLKLKLVQEGKSITNFFIEMIDKFINENTKKQ